MVITDDFQKPSTDMSKIIVAVGRGLFSLLVLNIFDLLSFWTLVAVLVCVALVLKFGAPSVGTVVVIVGDISNHSVAGISRLAKSCGWRRRGLSSTVGKRLAGMAGKRRSGE